MQPSLNQHADAPGDAFLSRGERLRAAAARAGSAWVLLFAFLFAMQAQAMHVHLPGLLSPAPASLHAPVSSADVAGEAGDGVCLLCSSLVSDVARSAIDVQVRRLIVYGSVWMPHAAPTVPERAYHLFCRPPPVRPAAV